MADDIKGLKSRIRGRLAEWIIDDWISEHDLADDDVGRGIDKVLEYEFKESRAWIELKPDGDGLEFELTVGVNWSDRPAIKIPVCICEDAIIPLRELLADVRPDGHIWLGGNAETKSNE